MMVPEGVIVTKWFDYEKNEIWYGLEYKGKKSKFKVTHMEGILSDKMPGFGYCGVIFDRYRNALREIGYDW